MDMPSFEQLKSRIPNIEKLLPNADADAIGFFITEVIRFYSIAGTLLGSGFKLDSCASSHERYITHILSRSLLENYFAILYIFDNTSDDSLILNRYEELKNEFKIDYKKLDDELKQEKWREFIKKHELRLEPADPSWTEKT